MCNVYIYIYSIWLRTHGVSTHGAAAKVTDFERLGKKVRPGTFEKIKVGQRENPKGPRNPQLPPAANLRTKIPDFGGFDSSRILILRGGILHVHREFSRISSQGILEGVILVGRSGVPRKSRVLPPDGSKGELCCFQGCASGMRRA